MVGGAGHVLPALGVVGELVRRGHRVTMVTGKRFADEVAAIDARFVPYTSVFGDFLVPDVMAKYDAEQLLNDVYIADNEAMARAAEQVVAEDESNAVVHDVFHFIAGKLLPKKLNHPGVS